MAKVKSAMGQLVDFELMKIQSNIAQQQLSNRTNAATSATYLTNPLLDTPTDVVESVAAVEIYRQVHGTPVVPVPTPIVNPLNDPVATPDTSRVVQQPIPLNIATPASKDVPTSKEEVKEETPKDESTDDKTKKAK